MLKLFVLWDTPFEYRIIASTKEVLDQLLLDGEIEDFEGPFDTKGRAVDAVEKNCGMMTGLTIVRD